MGVDYSTAMGYGFTYPENGLPKSLLDYLGLPEDVDYIPEDALKERFPSLMVIPAGSPNYGDYVMAIVIESTYSCLEYRSTNLRHLGQPNGAELEELLRCHAELKMNHRQATVGWWVCLEAG